MGFENVLYDGGVGGDDIPVAEEAAEGVGVGGRY